MTPKALLVLSGGQDSTLCGFIAKSRGFDLHAVTFNYGQRHKREITASVEVASRLGIAHNHEIIHLGDGILAGTSPLVSNAPLEQYRDHTVLPGGLEKTFVPMRNMLFLTIAANRAYVLGCNVLFTGVCQEDFGGYPDCRRYFIDAVEDACNTGAFTSERDTLPSIKIITPLMYMSKAASVHQAMQYEGCYEALAWTHTGYDGAYPPVGKDHATLLRQKGFEEAGVPDPLVLRAVHSGLMELPVAPNYSGDLTKYMQLLGY